MRLLACLVALCLAGCASGVGAAIPLRAVGSASGDAEGPQVFLAGVPMNALVKIHGNVKYTAQPMPPYVTLDGDYTIIVEPLPGQEQAAQEAVSSGAMLIRRRGQPGALNAPGSIQSFKAARERSYIRSLPPAPPPPEPLKTSAVEPEMNDDASLVCDPSDLSCRLPSTLK